MAAKSTPPEVLDGLDIAAIFRNEALADLGPLRSVSAVDVGVTTDAPASALPHSASNGQGVEHDTESHASAKPGAT